MRTTTRTFKVKPQRKLVMVKMPRRSDDAKSITAYGTFNVDNNIKSVERKLLHSEIAKIISVHKAKQFYPVEAHYNEY